MRNLVKVELKMHYSTTSNQHCLIFCQSNKDIRPKLNRIIDHAIDLAMTRERATQLRTGTQWLCYWRRQWKVSVRQLSGDQDPSFTQAMCSLKDRRVSAQDQINSIIKSCLYRDPLERPTPLQLKMRVEGMFVGVTWGAIRRCIKLRLSGYM